VIGPEHPFVIGEDVKRLPQGRFGGIPVVVELDDGVRAVGAERR
jgi:hypothetical protein